MSSRTEHRALVTGALSLAVVLSGCAAAGSRNEVIRGRDDTKHAMMDLIMCDPCCGAVLRLLKIGAPAQHEMGCGMCGGGMMTHGAAAHRTASQPADADSIR